MARRLKAFVFNNPGMTLNNYLWMLWFQAATFKSCIVCLWLKLASTCFHMQLVRGVVTGQGFALTGQKLGTSAFWCDSSNSKLCQDMQIHSQLFIQLVSNRLITQGWSNIATKHAQVSSCDDNNIIFKIIFSQTLCQFSNFRPQTEHIKISQTLLWVCFTLQ